MRKQLLRLSVALVAVAAAALPARAFGGCPSHLTDGQMACHLTSGTSCESCTYRCDDGTRPTYNTCNMT